LIVPANEDGTTHNMNRTDIINTICRAVSAESYLEIGVYEGANFRSVDCARKVGIDPDPASAATHHMTSDEFFASSAETFDVIFVDGLHTEGQVARDVENSLSRLRPGGYLVCHDMNPTSREMQTEEYMGGMWTGQGWKHFAKLRMTRPDLEMYVVDADWGCGVIRRGAQDTIPWIQGLDYSHLESDRAGLLNLITVGDFVSRVQKSTGG